MKFYNKLKYLLKNIKPLKNRVKEQDLQLLSGSHDCGLRALYRVMPNLSIDKIKDGFGLACKHWPYGGITNVEYNIALRVLGLFDQFIYDDKDSDLGVYLSNTDSTFILLIHGHFTVVKNGKIEDTNFYQKNMKEYEKVYCSWELRNR